MKYLIILFLSFLSAKSFSQCSVNVSTLSDIIIYEASNEAIYKNSDLENGIQAAYLRLVIFQNASDKEKLQFYIKVTSAKGGAKTLIVPRQLIIKYNDGKSLTLEADELAQIKPQSSFYTQEATFRIYSWLFEDLQTKSISEILITDTRTHQRITAQPFSNLIKEQANCLALRIK